MSLTIDHVKGLSPIGEIAKIRFNASLEQPAHHLREDQLSRLRLRQHIMDHVRIHHSLLHSVGIRCRPCACTSFFSVVTSALCSLRESGLKNSSSFWSAIAASA